VRPDVVGASPGCERGERPVGEASPAIAATGDPTACCGGDPGARGEPAAPGSGHAGGPREHTTAPALRPLVKPTPARRGSSGSAAACVCAHNSL